MITQFTFDTRPHHRETIDSYSRRILTINHSTDIHKPALITATAEFRSNCTPIHGSSTNDAWVETLTLLNRRPTLHLEGDPAAWERHPNGSSCAHCGTLIPARWACTLCTHGEHIQQNSHFDDLVCTRHNRWVGLTDHPDTQHQVATETVAAAHTLRRLRTRGIDSYRYLLVHRLISDTFPNTESSAKRASAAFAPTVALLRTTSTKGFMSRFFDTSRAFADTYTYLAEAVADALGHDAPSVARGLWLHLRPAVAALRRSIMQGEDYEPSWAHDYIIDTSVARTLTQAADALEPFTNYLPLTGDTTVSAVFFDVSVRFNRRIDSPTTHPEMRRPALMVCDNGHEFEYAQPTEFTAAGNGRTHFTPTCGFCTARRVSPGINDLATLNPTAAAQFDVLRNGGLTARDIAASSKQQYFWRCPKGHSHETSPAKKTNGQYGCPVCSNRTIVPGVNCLVTTHPQIAAELESTYGRESPAMLAAGSDRLATWTCENEHSYKARIYERTTKGVNCPHCEATTNRRSGTNITTTHPVLAEEWHPTRNDDLTADAVTRGSRTKAWWICKNGHEFAQRIDKRTAGAGCGICSNRTLVSGINDLATTDPTLVCEFHSYLNGTKQPHKTFASTHQIWWRCLEAGHERQQTVQHRRESRGCTQCPPEKRLLANAV